MRRASLFLLVGCLLIPSIPTQAETVPLSFKSLRRGQWVLPVESYKRVSGAFKFSSLDGLEFASDLDGSQLKIDSDLDGKFDSTVEGKEGLVTFKAKLKDGTPWRYTIKLVNNGSGWRYKSSGAMTGKIADQIVRFIDQNNNGRFNDVGQDAVIIGREKHASFLGETLEIRGQLYNVKVSPNGTQVQAEAYEGPSGTLDLVSKFATKGKLLSVVVKSTDGKNSFNFSRRALKVPVGEYELHSGHLGLGRSIVRFTRGKMKTVKVEADKTHAIALGEPVKIDFKYVRQARRVIMAPSLVKYIGRGGEEYKIWKPFGSSPQFLVNDLESGKQIAIAVFGGC